MALIYLLHLHKSAFLSASARTHTHTLSLFLQFDQLFTATCILKQHTRYTFWSPPPQICLMPSYSQSYGLWLLSVHFTLVGRQCSRGVTNETHSSSIPLFFFLTWSHIHHRGLCWCPKPRSKCGNGWDLSPDTLGSSRFTTVHWSYPVATVAREGGWLAGLQRGPNEYLWPYVWLSGFSMSECAYHLKGKYTSSWYTNTH